MGILRSITFARALQEENKDGDFVTLGKTMKPIEIAEQYEMTDLDGDVLLAQSETKEGVVVIVAVAFKGKERRSFEVVGFSLRG